MTAFEPNIMMACPVVVTSVVTMSIKPNFHNFHANIFTTTPPPSSNTHSHWKACKFSVFSFLLGFKKENTVGQKYLPSSKTWEQIWQNWIWVKASWTENMLLGFDFWPNSLESMFCCGICKKILKISTPTSLSGRPVHHFYGSCDLNFVRLHSHKSDGLGGEFHPPKPPKTSKTTSKNHHLTTLHQAPNHQPTSTTPPKTLKSQHFWTEPFPNNEDSQSTFVYFNDFETWSGNWHITTEEDQGELIQALVK